MTRRLGDYTLGFGYLGNEPDPIVMQSTGTPEVMQADVFTPHPAPPQRFDKALPFLAAGALAYLARPGRRRRR